MGLKRTVLLIDVYKLSYTEIQQMYAEEFSNLKLDFDWHVKVLPITKDKEYIKLQIE